MTEGTGRKTRQLQLESVSKHFGGVTALSDVSFSVDRGETVALVGDNGAGKSTLIKLVSGVLQPDSGTIYIGGEAKAFKSPKDATDAGVHTVYQDLALAPNLSVVENLYLGHEITHPLARSVLKRPDMLAMEENASRFLADLGLTTINDVRMRVGMMSGGQRQTIAIARSVLRESAVLLLDEPTAALGVSQSQHVIELISRLKSQYTDLAIIVISHNMEEVFTVADRIVVIRLGSVAGVFNRADVTAEDVVAAIMGAKTGSRA